MKTINIVFLWAKFLLILNGENFNQLDNIVCVDGKKVQTYSMYKYYTHCSSAFDKISIYKYL